MRTAFIGIACLALGLAGCSKTDVASADAQKVPAKQAPAKQEGFQWPWSKPKTATIAAGTSIKVRTNVTLSTRDAKPGEKFSATLAEAIVVDGKMVLPVGTPLQGIVVDADEGGRVKGLASIAVRLTQLDSVAIQTSTLARTANATKKNDAVKIGIGAGIGAAIGAIAGGGDGAAIGAASGAGAGTGVVLATRGEPAVIGAESLLTFRLTSPVTVPLAG